MSSAPRRVSATEEQRTLGALLRAPFEAMLDHNYARLAEAGFTDLRPAHGAVLRYIAREGSRVTELAEQARMTKQSMSELVAHLVRRGYVEIAPDPADRRAKLARLTERGWRVHRTLSEASHAFERACARSLGEARWRQLRDLLEAFAARSREAGNWAALDPKPAPPRAGGRRRAAGS